MNLAGLPPAFKLPDASVGPARAQIRVFILDRNPVLSQCVSTSLSAFQTLDCSAISFDPKSPPPPSAFEDVGVVVFDPAQITSDAARYVAAMAALTGMHTVAYSFDTSDAMVNLALDAGIDCFASKEQDLSVLYLAIATASHGGRFLCPTIAQCFQRVRATGQGPSVQAEATDPKACLSARELAVITALASGLSQKQAAFDLNLSDKTISTYKTRAMRKLGLTDRASLVRFAIAQNLINQAVVDV